jgi:uncharacterized membrane protein SirB2
VHVEPKDLPPCGHTSGVPPSVAPEDLRQRWLSSSPHLVLLSVFGTLLCLGELKSRHYTRLLQEDGWAEWATFLAFATACVLGVQAFRESRDKVGRWERWYGLGLALFCLFVAGEEISWGQRLLGFRPPNYFLEQNYQQEANLHNLLKNVLDTRFMVMGIALGFGVIVPFLAHVTRLPAYLGAKLAYLPWYVGVAFVEFSYPYELVGELAELVLGLLFVVELASRRTGEGETAGAALAFKTQAVALAGAVLVVPLNDALLSLNAEAHRAAAVQDLETLAARMQAGEVATGKMLRKKFVHKRLYTAVQAGYLKLDPKRYYLDPWNNPYWIAYERDASGKGGTALLYSFGANRRRDSALDEGAGKGFGLGGDDVGIIVELPPRAQAQLRE